MLYFSSPCPCSVCHSELASSPPSRTYMDASPLHITPTMGPGSRNFSTTLDVLLKHSMTASPMFSHHIARDGLGWICRHCESTQPTQPTWGKEIRAIPHLRDLACECRGAISSILTTHPSVTFYCGGGRRWLGGGRLKLAVDKLRKGEGNIDGGLIHLA